MRVTIPIKVRYAETDRMGIAHHSKYLVWFEEARTEHSEALGVPYAEIEAHGVACPLLECGCKFISTCTYADRLRVECRLSECKPAHFEYRYTVYKEGQEKPIATGFTKHAWVDRATFKIVRLDRRLPEIFEKLAAACEPEE